MGGMGGGHYTAYVKTPAMENTWVEFDDSDVSKTDKSTVISSASYVLFYRRKD
jgi:ubiquitin carboxyl-terminal hydrolase 4/11/15